MHALKRVALVWTEYQENILNCIMQQSGIALFDVVFVRDTIIAKSALHERCAKLVKLKDISLSVREILASGTEIREKIQGNLPPEPFAVWLCNYQNPYGQAILGDRRCREIVVFEDGNGSYIDNGAFNINDGIRAAIATFCFKLLYLKYGNGFQELPAAKVREAWSLFPGCYPTLNLPLRIIDHRCFEKVLEPQVREREIIEVGADTAIYLPTALGDCKLISQQSDFEIEEECFSRYLRRFPAVKKVIWKPHPRSTPEATRLVTSRLAKLCGITIEVAGQGVNLEKFVFAVRSAAAVPVFSTISTALYVAEALSGRGLTVCSVRSEKLLRALKSSAQVYQMFSRIGIAVID